MIDLHITSKDAGVDIHVPMGEGPATPTGGFGGWIEVDRQDEIAATAWEGQNVIKQNVPIMLDGWGARQSVQAPLNTLMKLGRDTTGDEHVPPVFHMAGPIHFEQMAWVLGEDGIEFSSDDDDVIRGTDGTLYRQALVLHCMEYVKPGDLRLRHRKRVKSQRGKPGKTGGTAYPGNVYKVQNGDSGKGESLTEIAKKLYGDWREWKAIAKKNNLHDPNKKLKPGTKLRLP